MIQPAGWHFGELHQELMAQLDLDSHQSPKIGADNANDPFGLPMASGGQLCSKDTVFLTSWHIYDAAAVKSRRDQLSRLECSGQPNKIESKPETCSLGVLIPHC